MHDEYGQRGRSRSGGGGGGGGGGREGRGVPLADLDPALTEVSRKLIGCAIEVHKGLGPGFDEPIYQAALEHELREAGVPFASHGNVAVKYRGHDVGHKAADLIIDNRFIVEMMASRGEIGGADRAALRALLRAADMELGLIINFAERRLKDGLVRVLNPDKLNLPKGDHHDEDSHDSGFTEMDSESHA